MIEYTMLIILGICIGGLVAFLFVPSVWHRAVRLTTRQLEATMPMSLSEIEADKDLLRASYAVKIRRLEAGLNAARDKSANQLVEISRHQMEIAELKRQAAQLNAELDERQNAATIFETTIRKRLPELEQLVAAANSALDERAADLEDVKQKLLRREEMLNQVQRNATQQQKELQRLQAVLERQGEDKTSRFKRRPSEWGLDEYRSEYDRLNLEMSRMRQQLAQTSDVQTRQITVLKQEMQQLAERILTTASAQVAPTRDWRDHEAEMQPHDHAEPQPRQPQAPPSQRQAPLVTSKPWPDDEKKEKPPIVVAKLSKTDRPEPEASPNLLPSKTSQEPQNDGMSGPRKNLSALLAEAVKNEEKSSGADELRKDLPSKPPSDTESTMSETQSGPSASSNAKFDQVFREILDVRPQTAPEKSDGSSAATAETAATQPTNSSTAETADNTNPENGTKALLDRLRLIQGRQTG